MIYKQNVEWNDCNYNIIESVQLTSENMITWGLSFCHRPQKVKNKNSFDFFLSLENKDVKIYTMQMCFNARMDISDSQTYVVEKTTKLCMTRAIFKIW